MGKKNKKGSNNKKDSASSPKPAPAASKATSLVPKAEVKDAIVLPTNVVPERYAISLDVDLDKFSFEGEETVEVTVRSATKTIVLHSRELHIKSVTFKADGSEQEAEAIEIHYNLAQQDGRSAYTATFVFKDEIPVGSGKLRTTFTGCLNNQMAGFYRSGYTAANGEKRVMASTQFEALDARRAFPCWDEPAIKAVFDITLVVPTDRVAFSNMPEVESTELPNGRKRVHFMDTPKMSTYLVAFCVGEFDFVQAYSKNGVQVRVYTPPGKADTGRFSLDLATRTLDLYDDFFAIPYPLPKLDMVAIPEFAMGAMENWGLVTYREVDILIADTASNRQKQRVCTVVTHELAHQWFGNLVTMKWWDDLWLNEGFASWMENWAADQLFPEWKMWEQFTIDAQGRALKLDSLKTSHPIQVPIGHAEEVEEVFDLISYCKGASVVRMIHAVLGFEDFQKGLQVYMDRHKYGNTVTTDLWSAWAEVSGKNIVELMGSWTNQMGYPVLSCAIEGDQLKVEQSWFLADGSTPAQGQQWNVPLLVEGKGVSPFTEVMQGKSAAYALKGLGKSAWVKVNAGQHVPLRIKYSDAMFKALLGGLRDKSLPAADRAGLVSDTEALAKAGVIKTSMLIDAVTACAHNEDDYTVWEALAISIGSVADALADDKEWTDKFSANISKPITDAFNKLGWTQGADDGHLGGMLRGLLIKLLASYSKDEAIAAEARRRFNALLADPKTSELPNEYKEPVFKIVLKTSKTPEADYGALRKVYEEAELTADKKPVLFTLGHVTSAALKLQTLEWAISGEVKLQDFFYPMFGVSRSGPEGSELAFNFFRDNFGKLKSMLATASPSLFNAVISYCCTASSSTARADAIEQFFQANPLPLCARHISQQLESMRVNAAFAQRIKDEYNNKCPF